MCVCVCVWLACSKAGIPVRGLLLCMALGLASLLQNRDVLDSFETKLLQRSNLKPQIISAHNNKRGLKHKNSTHQTKQVIGYTQENQLDVQQHRNLVVCQTNTSCNWGNQILFRRRTLSAEIISVHNNSSHQDKHVTSFAQALLDWMRGKMRGKKILWIHPITFPSSSDHEM